MGSVKPFSLPNPRDEDWRWSDLSRLPELAARPGSGAIPSALPWLDCDRKGPLLLFVDGRFAADRSRPGPVETGLVHVPEHDHPIAALAADAGNGWRLRLGRDHAPAGLIQIVHLSTGGADPLAAQIHLDDDAQASIVETFVGEGWTNRLNSIRLGRSARLMLNRRLIGSDGMVTLTDRAELDQGASLQLGLLGAGGRDSRIDCRIGLLGEHAFAEYAAALLARGRQRHDANLVVRHEALHGMSRQIWRSVADDRATCAVAARVEVARPAQKTDAEQSLKGLILAKGAKINAKPELEIFADDVKCAHGATVGQLDPQALFYLESRGLEPTEARALLTGAFVDDALGRIGEEQVRDAFEADARAWFG